MVSKLGVVAVPTFEDGVRAILLLVDVVGISLAFIDTRAAYIVLGAMFAISIIFNVSVILGQSTKTRKMLKDGKAVCPFVPALGLEILGTFAFLVVFVIATVDTTGGSHYYYGYADPSTMYIRAYAGMSGLVASILHGFLAIKRTNQMLHFHRSIENPCPHCHRGIIGFYTPPTRSEQISPLALEGQDQPVKAEQSTRANIVGETENDNLIMKD